VSKGLTFNITPRVKPLLTCGLLQFHQRQSFDDISFFDMFFDDLGHGRCDSARQKMATDAKFAYVMELVERECKIANIAGLTPIVS